MFGNVRGLRLVAFAVALAAALALAGSVSARAERSEPQQPEAVSAAAPTRFAVVSLRRGGFALVSERGRIVARSDVLPALSSRGVVATASHDGRVAYGVAYRRLGTAGGHLVRWFAGPAPPSLAFSADGASLAVAHRGGIAVVSVASGKLRSLRLVPNASDVYSNPAFSPDGSLLTFVRTSGDGRAGTLRAEVQVAAVAGGRARTLHVVSDAYNFKPSPQFTPDGTRIAFVLDDAQVVTVPTGGGALEAVTRRETRATLSSFVVLPDGSGYVFARTPGRGVADVWRADSDGRLARLTVTPIPPRGRPHYGTAPLAVSPDAERLLLGRRTALATVPLHGGRVSTPRELGAQPQAGYWNPDPGAAADR